MDTSEQHLEDLKEIRKMMEKSSRFLSLSGLSGIAAGLVALAGAAIAFFVLGYPHRFFMSGEGYAGGVQMHAETIPALMLDGIVMLIAALGLSFYFTRRRARKNGLSLWDETTRRMLLAIAFPLISGGILCLIMIFQGLIYIVAPLTLVFYGLALIAASQYTVNELKILGISDTVLGLLAGVFPGYGLFFWAAGFGFFHILYGYRMYRKYER